jgi:RNA polymerase sigma-70 factor (ECF subfamily)
MSAADETTEFLAALEAHKKILYKVAGAYSDNATDRQELLQELTIQLWRSLPRFDRRSKLSTFVYRVALNVAISFARDQRRRAGHTVALDESVLEIAGTSGDDEGRRAIGELLGRLDEVERALVILYLEGHAHDAIGEILGISAGNVAVRINRIKTRLRKGAQSQGG